jgi:PEP-CTERM motif
VTTATFSPKLEEFTMNNLCKLGFGRLVPYRFPLLFVTMAWLAAPLWANASPLANTVFSFSGGTGFGVIQVTGGACTGPTGPGTFFASAVTALDGCALGLGGASGSPGTIVVGFGGGAVVNGVGDDIRFFDTFGAAEGLTVEASTDGVTFFSLGTGGTNFSQPCSFAIPCVVGFDLAAAGLTSASIFRLTAQQGGCVSGYPECYDLDAAEALNFSPVPEPTTLAIVSLGLTGLTITRRRKLASNRVVGAERDRGNAQ